MPKHLTIEERECIADLNARGRPQAEIAESLGRSRSTISRELRRNRTGDAYHAGQAQRMADRRRSQRPIIRKMDRPEIQQCVRSGLAKYWSPEQVSGRMKRDLPDDSRARVSHQTIYTWIKRSDERRHWESRLRRRGKRPRPRKTPDETASAARIDRRPEAIERRARRGDFEGDTVLGPPGTGGLATLVDRKTRYTIAMKVNRKNADHVHRKIRDAVKHLGAELLKSITFDNGTEFARCRRLEKYFGTRIYYAAPGRPWQRGTNENTNGLLRQFFPKGTDFRDITHAEVRRAVQLINNRPRACLDYRTPEEVFLETQPP